MTEALKTMLRDYQNISFAKLTDRSIISTLNRTQREFADDGSQFYHFLRSGVLYTMEINREVNFNWIFTMKINGKTEYLRSGEKFRELVLKNAATL